MYPDHIKIQIQDYFAQNIQHSSMLSGGSIASSWKLDLANGLSYVLKINPIKEMVQPRSMGSMNWSNRERSVLQGLPLSRDWLVRVH